VLIVFSKLEKLFIDCDEQLFSIRWYFCAMISIRQI